MAPRKKVPDATIAGKATPTPEIKTKPTPEVTRTHKEQPQVGNPENTVMIGGTPIEIKSTKLKYQRNNTALFYKVLDIYPLPDVLAMPSGTFGDDRDGDKALMDWLIAATNNEELIVANYDDIDTETVEKILSIFKRQNKFDEKNEKRKNVEKERKEAV